VLVRPENDQIDVLIPSDGCEKAYKFLKLEIIANFRKKVNKLLYNSDTMKLEFGQRGAYKKYTAVECKTMFFEPRGGFLAILVLRKATAEGVKFIHFMFRGVLLY